MDWPEVWKAVLIGLPSFTLGYLAYRRSQKVDRVSALSGAATETRAGTSQVIEGLNMLIDNLQDDNKIFREEIRLLNARLETCFAEREDLRRKLTRLARLYGDNNGDTPPPMNKEGL